MRGFAGRVATFLTVALLVWGATIVMRPIPQRRAGEVLSGQRRVWTERVDSLESGETITAMLARAGLSEDEAQDALDAALPGIDPRRLRAGMKVTLGAAEDSQPSQIVLHLGSERLLRLSRSDSGWVAREEAIPWTTDTVVVSGTVRSTLIDAFVQGARELSATARSELAWDVADVFEYKIDMSRDLQAGDAFHVVVERRRSAAGATRVGDVLGVDYVSSGRRVRAIRLPAGQGEKGRYFDDSGKSMQALFLRAPLEFRHMSSQFGMRRHPILGIVRAHRGTDYAASSGTPVRSIGDGVVVRAGRVSGFGNVIDVRHPNGYVSRYGHLRGFAQGITAGRSVTIGQTIGYVGMTGLATAPHLHFEVLVKGVQQNPKVVLESRETAPLSATDRAAFEGARARVIALLERRTTATAVP